MHLLTYLEGEPTDSDAARVSELASRLQQSHLRKRPPAFVDEVDGEDRTVGLLAVISPPGDDAALEEATLAEVVRIVEAIEEFTKRPMTCSLGSSMEPLSAGSRPDREIGCSRRASSLPGANT